MNCLFDDPTVLINEEGEKLPILDFGYSPNSDFNIYESKLNSLSGSSNKEEKINVVKNEKKQTNLPENNNFMTQKFTKIKNEIKEFFGKDKNDFKLVRFLLSFYSNFFIICFLFYFNRAYSHFTE